MKNILLIAVLLSFNVRAENKKFVLKNYTLLGQKIVEIDLNQDGKADRIEKYVGDNLVALETDSRFSGLIDEWSSFSEFKNSTTPVEITKKDTNRDGRVDRIETVYKEPQKDILIVKTEIDTLFSGTFDKKFVTHSKLQQKKDNAKCESLKFDDLKIMRLTRDVGKVNMSLTKGYYVTDYGYKIHHSCLDKWGAETFVSTLKSSMSKGFQCLARLANDNKAKNLEPNGALKNLMGLEYLASGNDISIVCNEKNYDWKGTAGHASTEPGQVIKELGVKHPYISINQSDPKVKTKPSEEEQKELGATLFHEQLHNLGIRHNESVEFPYACETCCVKDVDEAKKADACKVCSGVYSGATDTNYLKDMIAYGKSNYEGDKSTKAIIKYQKEFPRDRWALFAYADASTDIFSPVGVEMSKLLKERFKDLNEEEAAHLKNADYYADEKSFLKADVSSYAKLVASSHLGHYYDGQTSKVLQNIAANKSDIKAMIIKEEKATDNTKYILGSVKKKLRDMLLDIYLSDYPHTGKPESTQARKIMEELGLIR